MGERLDAARVKAVARECGFELAGIARTAPAEDYARYRAWVDSGMAGEMRYLTDRRADLRGDPQLLLEGARSMLCVGKLYNVPFAYSTAWTDSERAWISRYAWGADYHDVLRAGLGRVAAALKALSAEPFQWKICVDTAPLLERSYARLAGLGWIAKNTCLINQAQGSWFFLGELLLTLELAPDAPPPDRCGTCRSCIDACPTAAIVPDDDGGWQLDARMCISYLTIEKRGVVEEQFHDGMERHVFGCDICQDVCPWNRSAAVTSEAEFQPREEAPPLERLAALSEEEFRAQFHDSPVWRARYTGFLRNVAIAMGATPGERFRPALERLAGHGDASVAAAAREALRRCAANPSATRERTKTPSSVRHSPKMEL